ncbi:MAG: hypothetical protein EZS28_012229 [Streblomastix strix]|uniref:Uncharacterized protein n=1 Tax=Streblomastix strix TaxID=222440 RepID=A0A5J4WC58_9EUKA|nr:MAG: hypothetical protein EZS28_012229 [Streblomastix strix]
MKEDAVDLASSSYRFQWTTELLDKVKRVKELQTEVFEGKYGTKLEILDMTSEEASLEIRSDIRKPELTFRQWMKDEKDAAILADALEFTDEPEMQWLAIYFFMKTETSMADMIMGNREMAMTELLSSNHALQIFVVDSKMRREIAIAPKDAQEVLKTGGGATLLYCHSWKQYVDAIIAAIGTS